MKEFMIKLKEVADVQEFVAIISECDSDFDLISGKYVVDAKSILGIFSLNLKNDLKLKIYSCDDNIVNKLEKFIIKEI